MQPNPALFLAQYFRHNNNMTDKQKIHKILEYICGLPENVNSVDTDIISQTIKLSLAETNILAREIIENGDTLDCTTKDNAKTHSVCLSRIQATKDAFESRKYLKGEPEIAIKVIDDNQKQNAFIRFLKKFWWAIIVPLIIGIILIGIEKIWFN